MAKVRNCGLVLPNVELSGSQWHGVLDSKRKMGRKPSAWWPVRHAVGAPLERRVRHRRISSYLGGLISERFIHFSTGVVIQFRQLPL